MIDRDGYRLNVGIILSNTRNQVFWGKRVREDAWQFPQGGMKRGETPEQAMYRELEEEVGLLSCHVRILGRTRPACARIPHQASRSMASLRSPLPKSGRTTPAQPEGVRDRRTQRWIPGSGPVGAAGTRQGLQSGVASSR